MTVESQTQNTPMGPSSPLGEHLNDLGDGVSDRGLGRKAVEGALITAGFTVGWELIKAVSGLITAHFLDPRDFAVVGAAILAVGIAGALTSLNIEKRLVQSYADPGEAYDAGFTMLLAVSALNVVAAVVAAPFIARLYGNAVLVPICVVLGAQALLQPFTLPSIYWQREMQWWRQRTVSSLGPAVTVVTTLGLAVAHFGAWAIVAGMVAGNVVGTATVWIFSDRRPRLHTRISREHMTFFFAFGWPLWAGGVAAIVLSNTLVFETQLILGLAFLGYIRVATNLGERIDKAEHVLAAVMFPVLSRSRDAGFKRRAYEATSKLILVWAVPTGIGLAVFSDDIVRHVLGAQWRAITPLLWVEGIGEVFNAIATMWSMFYMVEGDNRPTMWVGLSTNILLVALIAALAPVLHYAGVVVALSVVIVVSLFQRRYFLLRLLPGAPVIKPALPFLLAGTVAGGCALVLRSQGLGNSLGLALRVAVYLAIYLGIVLLLQRGFLRQSMATLRGNSGR